MESIFVLIIVLDLIALAFHYIINNQKNNNRKIKYIFAYASINSAFEKTLFIESCAYSQITNIKKLNTWIIDF